MAAASFSARIIRWQRKSGRHDLPWQGTRDAYRIWLSEVMLQQTQVATVIPYYERFVARFPTVAALAAATEDEVLALWSGLGYYARARNLHRAARTVVDEYGGVFPRSAAALARLPGIGRSTAAAIAAFAGGEVGAILDGNVKRVLARHAAIAGDPSSAAVLERLWETAQSRLPRKEIEAYTQGLMDLGADVCVAKPRCEACPVASDCEARVTGRIAELPARRKRKVAPRRRIGMVVMLSRGEVLLEKRPADGIWGGLWSLPEIGAAERPRAAQRLEPFVHAFTHFTLEVTPWLVRARSRVERPGTMWLAMSDLQGAALPSPVRKLLASLYASPLTSYRLPLTARSAPAA